MTDDTLLLIGRRTAGARGALETHAERLRDRDVAGRVRTATYDSEPVRELRDELADVSADRTYVVPACVAHSHETTKDLPAALSFISGETRYCEPLGRGPALTSVVLDRAAAVAPTGEGTSLVLVGFGNSSRPYHRQVAEYHAARIRERSTYGGVHACYLLQSPAVECARYNVSTDGAVAVPLFLARSEITEERIPAKLELDRGGVAYADPLGDHPRVTDAIHAELEKQRVFAEHGGDAPASYEASLARTRRPVATDGEGAPR